LRLSATNSDDAKSLTSQRCERARIAISLISPIINKGKRASSRDCGGHVPYVSGSQKAYDAERQKSGGGPALARGADIIVMLHPDYQYTPKLVTAMASMISSEQFDVVLASRILGRGALIGGMPVYKYIANRILTLTQNLLVGHKLSEYHTGYRAWSRNVLQSLPLLNCSDDFVFDNQMLAQAINWDFKIGEISCPTKYFPEASSINFRRSVIYGLGVLKTSIDFRLHRIGLTRPLIFSNPPESRLEALPPLAAVA
jgi:hypothetical protein